MLFEWLNDYTTFAPNKYPAPRGESTHPEMSMSCNNYRRGRTTLNRTLNRRGGFPACGRWSGSEWDGSYFVNGVVDAGAESAVDAEDAIIDDGGEREVVKDISAIPPDIERAILPEAFIIEAIHLRDLTALMITSDQRDQIRIANFICKQQEERLNTIEPAVYKISQEKIAYARNISAISKKLQQVIELSMNIAANCDGRVDTLNVPFLHQDLSCLWA